MPIQARRAVLVATSIFLATLSCATPPRALAGPEAPAQGEPLVRAELKDDADVARAIREYYTKYEYRVPMRDGVHLYTQVYVPKDRTRTYPILMTRTPYSVAPYGDDNYPTTANVRSLRKLAPSTAFIRQGYILVHQDVRGRLMSEGTFVDVRPHRTDPKGIDESTDAYDTIDWLVKNVPANNGRVGVWGISYPGFYAAQAAIDAHPALKAVSPQAPVTEWFLGDDFHHNGAFFESAAFDFYSNFGKPRPKPTKKIPWDVDHGGADVYDFYLGLGALADAKKTYLEDKIPFVNELYQHPNRDAWWVARDPRPFYKDSKPAILTVGGWFDAEDLYGTLETYRAFEKQRPRSANTIVMGPWRHGGWARTDGDRLGDVTFGQKTSFFFRDAIEFPFFERYLRGKAGPAEPEAWVFETGTNTWQRYTSWPPPGAKKATLHFEPQGRLALASPLAAAASQADAFDAYVSDPNKPVPYRAKHSDEIDEDYMSEDQRFAARRPDVLVYETKALADDVTLAGPLEASLWVSTTGTDADFVVKLVDVYPDDEADPVPNPTGVKMGGYQQLVRGEIMRGRYRKAYDRPVPFTPNEPDLVRFTLPDVCHTFRAGHRIMVQVQSSWFPLAGRNPQTFVDVYTAKPSDFRAATHRVFHTPDKPSGLTVTVLGTLPNDL